MKEDRKSSIDPFDEGFEEFLDTLDIKDSYFANTGKRPTTLSPYETKNKDNGQNIPPKDWKKATHIKRNKTNTNQASMSKLKKALLILTLAALGITSYNIAYNSDFVKHFWDDTETRIEERRNERKEFEKLAQEAANKVINEQEEGEER